VNRGISSPVRDRERKRDLFINCPELLFLFLKGMMGALAPNSYLVENNLVWVDETALA
jgi:hypothetical protein